MRKIIFMLGSLVLAFTACQQNEFLDAKTDSALNADKVFADSVQTIAFLTQIYDDADFSFDKSGAFRTEHAADDGESRATLGTTDISYTLANGFTNPSSLNVEFWSLPYRNIRRVNIFLDRLPASPLSAAKKERMAAEARFLRAWYYHFLMKYFGGVPILHDKVFGIQEETNEPRQTYAACVDYLVKELDEAAAMLPMPGASAGSGNYYSEIDYGRITRGACQALKSRILLFAASPLHNGGAITQEPGLVELVSYPVASPDKWQKAAQAALDVINTGSYSLFEDNVTRPGNGFYQVFLERTNAEYIFAANKAPNKTLETYYNPPSRGGNRSTMPTQNLVEAFPMKDGRFPMKNSLAPAIGEPSKYAYNLNPNPYLNLDPRFYFTIIHNGAPYFLTSSNAKVPVNTYLAAVNDGYDVSIYAMNHTGYYCRKMCDENIAANSSFNTNRGWPLIRYAEVLLNYAEAIAEAGQPDLAYAPLIAIRKRAGIEPGSDNRYGLKPGMSTAEMRAVVRNERRIELAFEDHRWFDVRRWKLGVANLNAPNKAMKITPVGSTFTHEIVNVNTQKIMVFPEQMYLLPIPDGEMRKMPALKQNPKW